jgi:hypothetical protein
MISLSPSLLIIVVAFLIIALVKGDIAAGIRCRWLTVFFRARERAKSVPKSHLRLNR